jgi:hypothetical protein
MRKSPPRIQVVAPQDLPDSGIFLASYKGTHASWQGHVNRGIRLLDRSIYSHSEIAVGNPFLGAVPCVSSSGVDGGVRQKVMQLNPKNWDVLPLHWVSQEHVDAFLESEAGKAYDFGGVARFALPMMVREHPTKWFCSEACASIAGLAEAWRLTPAGLYAVAWARLNRMGGAE